MRSRPGADMKKGRRAPFADGEARRVGQWAAVVLMSHARRRFPGATLQFD
ncbi:hypothetical protein N787_07405 [Arenimonas metalli CF5-1]|uniref:Uncharacterized protein n=1 Tax=Arenimonas metalli CF5-1 TaxID=1384056 RepID=A0A091BU87_9GAMM|nr:hypothetical protein N787_07405 [Arenimonas metalli CF5-1]